MFKIIQPYLNTFGSENLELAKEADLVNTINKSGVRYRDSAINPVSDSVDSSELLFKKLLMDPPKENNILGSIQDLLDEYNSFLSGLNPEQHAILTNTIALITILFCINNIISIYFGDKFIKYFNLESKFPKLLKFFELRKKIQDRVFIGNIVFIYFILIIFISVNVFFFFN